MEYDLSKNINPWIPGLCCYTPGKTISGYVKLASNENNYGPSPKVAEAIKAALPELRTYPYRDSQLSEKIAKYCGVAKENIITGNGSDESIDLAYKTFKGPVHSFNPTYSEYRIFSEGLGGKYAETDLEPDYSLSVKKFLKESKDAGILVLCSPNNPTGTVIPEGDLVEILGAGKTTVVDEAYVEFYGKSFTSLVKDYKNLILLRTFSKAFALAGVRVGYIVTDPEAVEALGKVKPPFSVNSLAQAAAIAALDDVAYMKKTVEKIRSDREMMYKELSKKYKTTRSESNFILFDVSPAKAKDVYDKFMEKKIIVRTPGKYRDFSGEYIRVTIGTTEENKKFVAALKEI
jgi:histidinol-phosphate aminotransferase